MRKIGIAIGGGHAFGVPILFILIASFFIITRMSKNSQSTATLR